MYKDHGEALSISIARSEAASLNLALNRPVRVTSKGRRLWWIVPCYHGRHAYRIKLFTTAMKYGQRASINDEAFIVRTCLLCGNCIEVVYAAGDRRYAHECY